jgi:hypothetical protein
MGINNKKQETVTALFDALNRELEKEPISAATVTALAMAMEALSEKHINLPFNLEKTSEFNDITEFAQVVVEKLKEHNDVLCAITRTQNR